ncbi:MAG: TolB protein [Actinomycetota bacterium]|jgi:Tol biopolymer transport system component|nr:TolB protein [Actinomycetota bacterium]
MKRKIVLIVAVVASCCWMAAGLIPAYATTPDPNGRIAFSMDFGLGAEIYTIRQSGLDIQQLTEVGGSAESPDWSPDGRRIVFHIVDQGLWMVKANGSQLHQVVGSGFQPAFTPDGRHLVYDCGDCAGGQGIFLMKADGSDAPGARLTTNPSGFEGDTNPEISPDGQTITFVRRKVEGELQGLFAVDIDGTDLRELVPYRFNVFIKHDWAPNGEHIVFTSPIEGQPNVYTVAPDGSHLVQLTHVQSGSGALAGSYSPDGRWIAFRGENPSIGLYRLMKMRPNGCDHVIVTTAPIGERYIDWGPAPN